MEATVKCGFCGDESRLDMFCATPVFGLLPKDTYQCPCCGVAFERRMGAPKVYESGFVIPGEIEIVKVQGFM